MTFANNPSPSFLLSYLANSCLGRQNLRPRNPGNPVFVLHALHAVFPLCGVQKSYHRHTHNKILTKRDISYSPTGAIVDVSIMNGFETITRLGGYILIFSLLSAFIRHYWPFSRVSGGLLLGITEITTGLHRRNCPHFRFPMTGSICFLCAPLLLGAFVFWHKPKAC